MYWCYTGKNGQAQHTQEPKTEQSSREILSSGATRREQYKPYIAKEGTSQEAPMNNHTATAVPYNSNTNKSSTASPICTACPLQRTAHWSALQPPACSCNSCPDNFDTTLRDVFHSACPVPRSFWCDVLNSGPVSEGLVLRRDHVPPPRSHAGVNVNVNNLLAISI